MTAEVVSMPGAPARNVRVRWRGLVNRLRRWAEYTGWLVWLIVALSFLENYLSSG